MTATTSMVNLTDHFENEEPREFTNAPAIIRQNFSRTDGLTKGLYKVGNHYASMEVYEGKVLAACGCEEPRPCKHMELAHPMFLEDCKERREFLTSHRYHRERKEKGEPKRGKNWITRSCVYCGGNAFNGIRIQTHDKKANLWSCQRCQTAEGQNDTDIVYNQLSLFSDIRVPEWADENSMKVLWEREQANNNRTNLGATMQESKQFKQFTGDILTSRSQAVVIPVNLKGVMGKGLALAAKKKYGEDYFASYKEGIEIFGMEIGSIGIYELDNGQFVINFPTKDDWRNPSKYEYIVAGLKKLADVCVELGIQTIAVPALGCGEGGLSWNVVADLINKHLVNDPRLLNLDVRVVLSEQPKSVLTGFLES